MLRYILIMIPLITSSLLWAQTFCALGVSGTLSDARGYKVAWTSSQMDAILKTKFSVLKNPKIIIQLPKCKSKIEIQSQIIKFDTVGKDFMFEKDVIVKMNSGILKTNFLKFNLARLDVTSFDDYAFQAQDKPLLLGQSFYGNGATYTLQLFNAKKSQSKIVQVSLK